LFPADLLGWIDLPPLREGAEDPARYWRAVDRDRRRLDPGDELFRVRLPGGGKPPHRKSSRAAQHWDDFVRTQWNAGAPPPLLLNFNFEETAAALNHVPEKLFKKKKKKLLRRWRRTIEALD